MPFYIFQISEIIFINTCKCDIVLDIFRLYIVMICDISRRIIAIRYSIVDRRRSQQDTLWKHWISWTLSDKMFALVLFGDGVYYICKKKDIIEKKNVCTIRYKNNRRYVGKIISFNGKYIIHVLYYRIKNK